MNKISIDRVIKMETYIYQRAKTNTLTQVELLSYLNWMDGINLYEYSDDDLRKFLNCLEELYGGDVDNYATLLGTMRPKLKFPPINLN